jgi:PIN domain nuclease of toxin-antitoxin system
MKLLLDTLDTHIFLWLIDADERLSAKFRQESRNPINISIIFIHTDLI